jgi:hypothetical protein
MLLSAVSVLVFAQSSSEIPEGLMNNPVYRRWNHRWNDTLNKAEVLGGKSVRAPLYHS